MADGRRDVDLLTGDDFEPSKSDAVVETTEVTVESHGPHSAGDLSRPSTPALVESEEAEASGELRTILSQEYPSTPGSSSAHSRRQSYSFTKKPTPEPDRPFDFNRFQEQLRSKPAEPIAKYLRSFLHEFSKRQWNNTEQDKIIRDFLDFIRGKMSVYEPFKSASAVEFDNAQEGMEKLIMNRLYPELFPPLLVAKFGKTFAHRMGHSEDLDRDQILADKTRIYSWVKEAHLDVPVGPTNDRFLGLAGIEINKLDQYRAPRDKIICVLNCCKVIFGLLRSIGSDESADKFVPLLILTLLRSNTPNLCSHVSFIQRFRHPDKLFGEAGYYLSSLCGAINFIEALGRQSLTISDKEYDEAVEAAVKRIKLEESVMPPSPLTPVAKSGLQLPSKDLVFEKASGLLNIAKPSLSSIGRLFSQEGSSDEEPTPYPDHRRTMRSRTPTMDDRSRPLQKSQSPPPRTDQEEDHRPRLPARHLSSSAPTSLSSPPIPPPPPAAAREGTSRKARRDRQESISHLAAMFEGIEVGVIAMVLDEKRGRVGASIDALLQIAGSG